MEDRVARFFNWLFSKWPFKNWKGFREDYQDGPLEEDR